jgi:hypothetical protein
MRMRKSLLPTSRPGTNLTKEALVDEQKCHTNLFIVCRAAPLKPTSGLQLSQSHRSYTLVHQSAKPSLSWMDLRIHQSHPLYQRRRQQFLINKTVKTCFLIKAAALLCRAQPLRDGLHVPSESDCRPPTRRFVSTGGDGCLSAGSKVQKAGGSSTRKQPIPLFVKNEVFLSC